MSDEKTVEQLKAEIAELKARQELEALKAERDALVNAPVVKAVSVETVKPPVLSAAAEVKPETRVTGIENLLNDPDVAAAYEAHKTKEPVSDKKEPVAAQIVQYLVIFREERVDFTLNTKNCYLRHASGGALFLRTPSGDKAFEVVTDKGRQTLTAALMDSCDVRTLSVLLQEMAIALAKAPALPPGSEDSNAQSALRGAINKLKGSAKTKEELAAAILQLLG